MELILTKNFIKKATTNYYYKTGKGNTKVIINEHHKEHKSENSAIFIRPMTLCRLFFLIYGDIINFIIILH